MPWKKKIERGGPDGHAFPSNVTRTTTDGKFPEKDGIPVGDYVLSGIRGPNALSTSNNKRPKIIGTFATGTAQGQSGWSSNADNPKRKSYMNNVIIPAMPLRSVPPTDPKIDSKNLLASNGKDDSIRQKVSSNNENLVVSQEERWEHEAEKLAALVSQAKEFLDTFSNKYSTSSGTNILEPEHVIEKTEDKGVANKFFAESIMKQDTENLSNGRMEVENAVSELIREKKSSRSANRYNEEDIIILTPAEWNMWQLHSENPSDGAQASMQRTKSDLVTVRSRGSIGKQKNILKSRGIEIVDRAGVRSVGVGSNQRCPEFSDGELTETLSGEKHLESGFLDMDERESEHQNKHCKSTEKYIMDEYLATVKSFDTGSNDKPKDHENPKELINLSIVQRDQPEAVKVRQALKFFEEQYTELLRKADPRREGKGTNVAHLDAAKCLKVQGMWNHPKQPFGHIPGVEIGQTFRFRAELAVVGIHHQLVSGIDYVVLDGKKFATSVVNSGRYENKAQAHDILIYSGQGGNLNIANKAVDQKLEKGNLALVNSMEMGYPVRVTHKRKSWNASTTLDFRNEDNLIYTYDGLYIIKKYWGQRAQNHKMVFKFELHRLSCQPRPFTRVGKSRKSIFGKEVCMIEDVSNGKEKMHIHAMNAVDNVRPSPFVYMTKIVYPNWFRPIDPIGCECINVCSDSQQCPCVLKNGGEIPFNEKGAIVKAKSLVLECGPSCKCPPTCMNRVSQHGPRYQLEIFKTKSRGWGVRSRNYVLSGSFICEYVGELLEDKEAEQRIGHDEYLFDISNGHNEEFEGFLGSKPRDVGFAINAAKYGNVGRYINHSCSPNLYAQEVLYDHYDKRVPHIMFFATKNIHPQQDSLMIIIIRLIEFVMGMETLRKRIAIVVLVSALGGCINNLFFFLA